MMHATRTYLCEVNRALLTLVLGFGFFLPASFKKHFLYKTNAGLGRMPQSGERH